MHYDLFDLAPYLQPGENVVAAYVKYYGRAKSHWIPAVANMTLGKTGVMVFEADLGQGRWLVSDQTWRAHKSDAWSEAPVVEGPIAGGVPVEIFDAGRFPFGWEQPDFDDSGWGNAHLIPAIHIGGFARTNPPTDPYGPLYPRPIAWLGGEVYAPEAVPVEKIGQTMQGIYEIDWDVENQVVLVQPFMSYVVHDAVAKAGEADRLPELYRRWSFFLADGYDTIGECWSWGTHVHGWSCTPTRDMVFYTLGVTPAEPGYTVARIAPRLGDLEWAEGRVPIPHGPIGGRAEPGKVSVDSPVPVIVDLPGQAPQSLPAGAHEVTAG